MDPLLDRHLGGLEGVVARLPGDVGEIPADVVGGADVGRRSAVERRLQVGCGREHLVVDLHQVGRIGRLVLVLGDHDCHRLTLEADLAVRDRIAIGRLLLFRHEGRRDRHGAANDLLEVFRHQYGDNPGGLLRRGNIQVRDPGVGVRTAHHRHMRGPGSREVIRVAAVARDEARIFATLYASADHLADRHLSPLRR